MDLKEIGWGAMDWIDLEASCEHDDESAGSIKCWGNLG
jgi:hypothetical protein